MPNGTPADWLTAVDANEVHLAFPLEVHEDLMDVLFPSEGHPFYGMGERGAFCVLAKSTGTHRATYIVEDVVHPESADDLELKGGRSSDDGPSGGRFTELLFGGNSDIASSDDAVIGYEFSEDYHERAVARAKERGGGLIRIHTQPGGVRESSTDIDSAARVYRNDRDRLPTGAPFAAAITNDKGDWSARVYEPATDGGNKPTVTRADRVRVVGPATDGPSIRIQPTGGQTSSDDLTGIDRSQQDSTIQLWGEDGQAALADITVGLVGCGGVGSILAEHLARLGVGEIVFVDFDRLEAANFNRAQGAKRIDVRQNRLKTEIAEREARHAATAEQFETRVVDGSVVEEKREWAAVPALLDCDVIMSAVDAARPRQIIGAIARAHCIPVIDGGSKLHAEADGTLESEAKIETAVAGPGWPCFKCQRVWTQADVDWEADHPEFRGERGYVDGGVDPDEEDRDPSVIGVNAIAAGLMQRRFLALTLGVADGIVGTQRLQVRDVETNWSSVYGCQDGCDAPPIGVGDRYELPTGTGWAMRYERDDIPMPETKTKDASDLVEDSLSE
ncbi:ThiF family adenylyltransferase [Haloterrigena salifodinae]|uniref:ThiF family adenylyltransferase n=1 Tax=Haloterrigena salifodinae TaxID=2675099 RepID=A0A8T8E4L0_9EURY|nr:ThiF family adenylyltransferase [Haloterrigena salifodinae]QRV16321.1 ThiF family adenylyltransferase [Haloterrigena salifodinae]